MRGLLRLSAALLGSLALGSWVGVGGPGLDEARARLEPSPIASAQAPPPTFAELAPLPQQSDPSSAPAVRPWPSLNPEASVQRAWMIAEGPRHEIGDPHRLVTLTFDDGPFLETTPMVLRLLAREKIRATFFVVGQYLDGNDRRSRATRALLRKIVDAGHLVGNHTHDHAHLPLRSHTQVLEQIDQGAASIERATGSRPILLRPPYGELDAFGEQAARERGLDVVLWNVDARDMIRKDSHQMFKEITRALDYKEGGVVLLHDIRFSSVAVLRELLPWLKEHRWYPKRPTRVGYEVVDLPKYLRAVEAAPMPYATREELERVREQRARLRRAPRPPDESDPQG